MFQDGDQYETEFETPAGRVQVLAEVVVGGRRIAFRNLVVFAVGDEPPAVGVVPLLRWVNLQKPALVERWVDERSDHRSPNLGATPGRAVNLVDTLHRRRRS